MTGINEIVNKTINETILSGIKENKNFIASKIHGIAVPLKRTALIAENKEIQLTIPVMLSDIYDDGKIIDIDDSIPFMIYHKLERVDVSIKKGSEYGRANDMKKTIVDSYKLYLIACLDSRKTKLSSDEIMILISNMISRNYTFGEYSIIEVIVNSLALNSSDIYAAEYVNHPNTLPSTLNLFRINYTMNTYRDLSACVVKC